VTLTPQVVEVRGPQVDVRLHERDAIDNSFNGILLFRP
jgi:hypothetical protein